MKHKPRPTLWAFIKRIWNGIFWWRCDMKNCTKEVTSESFYNDHPNMNPLPAVTSDAGFDSREDVDTYNATSRLMGFHD